MPAGATPDPVPRNVAGGRKNVSDLVFLALGLGCFGLMALYARLLARG